MARDDGRVRKRTDDTLARIKTFRDQTRQPRIGPQRFTSADRLELLAACGAPPQRAALDFDLLGHRLGFRRVLLTGTSHRTS